MSAVAPRKPLKSSNLMLLCALVAADVVTLAVLVVPAELAAAPLTVALVLRAAMLSSLPVVVLILSQLLPGPVKASLVFWRFKDALPGHRAFTKYAHEDPRVNVAAVKKKLGGRLPTDPRDQNTTWYKLYTQVADEPAIVDANRAFLLFREVAAISMLLVLVIPLSLMAIGASTRVIWMAVALFAVQHVVTAIAARNSGVALVTNVLALHGADKKPRPKRR